MSEHPLGHGEKDRGHLALCNVQNGKINTTKSTTHGRGFEDVHVHSNEILVGYFLY